MKFLIEWIPDGQNASAEERSTLCRLGISLGDRDISATYDLVTKKNSDRIVLPAVHLAEGIALDWWRIFGGRDVVHSVSPWRTGFALPDLSFEFDGTSFAVSCKTSASANPPLLFWQEGTEFLSRAQAEAALQGFVESVVDKLSKDGITDCEVAVAWTRVRESLADNSESAFCEAAGALGVDPYAVKDSDTGLIERAAKLFSGKALLEFLAGVRVEYASSKGDRSEALNWIEKLRPYHYSRLSELPAVAMQISKATKQEKNRPPWARGRRAATAFRDIIGLNGTVAVSIKHIAESLGGRYFRGKKGPRGVAAVVDRREQDVHVHLRDRGNRKWANSAETFAFARAIGDAVCFPSTSLSAINGLHKAERQAVGRAFAAEVLAPIETVLGMREEGHDAEEIAGLLDVNQMVVEHQIANYAGGFAYS